MARSEVHHVAGVFVVGTHEGFREIAIHALEEAPVNVCLSAYDLIDNEIIAIANPPEFLFHDPQDPTTIMSSDEMLSHLLPQQIQERVSGLVRSTHLTENEENRYSVLYRFPRVGLTRLDFVAKRLLGDEHATRISVSEIYFVPLED